jgi:hypothetical protein
MPQCQIFNACASIRSPQTSCHIGTKRSYSEADRFSKHRVRAANRAARRIRRRAAVREEKCRDDVVEKVTPDTSECSWNPIEADLRAVEDEPMTGKPDMLILLDWDDTVLPTSYLAQKGIGLDDPVPDDVSEALAKYAAHARATLEILQERGHLVIVTNAEEGWVELTCAKFLPALEPVIRNVECVSARSCYEPQGYVTPVEWKEEAFAAVVQRHFADPCGQWVFSLGDARHEREAVHRIANRLGIAAKSVKLMELPDLAVLQREHELLREQLPELCAVDGTLDIRVDNEPVEPAA